MNGRKPLQKALAGSRNPRFLEVVALVEAFGIHWSRTSSSHPIFARLGIPELIYLQNVRSKALSGSSIPEACRTL